MGGTEELLPELPMTANEHPDALFVYPDVILSSYPRPQQLAEFAIKAQLPMINAFRFFTDAGGLMSYGATASEIYKSAAEQVAHRDRHIFNSVTRTTAVIGLGSGWRSRTRR